MADPRRRQRSLRFRLTALATLVVAIVLTITAVVLLAITRSQLESNLDASLNQRADSIVAALDVSGLAVIATSNAEDRALQLVAATGEVLASSDNLAGAGPIAAYVGNEQQVIANVGDIPIEDDTYRVLSRRIEAAGGPATLHVAENSDDRRGTLQILTWVLAVAIPAIVGFLAWLIWWLTGRTLEPVETIRAEVDAITASNSVQRIHVPENDDEIAKLAATMNRMLDRLATATDQQRRFAADAAHELRTPLTRIRTNVEVDLAQPERAEPTTTNAAIRAEVIDLQHMIDDLLHLARSDAGHSDDHRSLLDMDDIVMNEVRRQRDATPRVSIDAGQVSAAEVLGDPQHLARVVRNLLSNAARHAESVVTVALSETASHVELAVVDDGAGVPVGLEHSIFERFTRVDDARDRSSGGTGLGLAITKDIIEQHGGTVAYDTGCTAGGRFVVTLPLGRDVDLERYP